MEATADQFRALCSDPNADARKLHENSQELFNLLIAPIESRLTRGRSLVLEPDGSLSEIPFRALISPSNQYLADMFETTISPGMMYRSTSPASRIVPSDRALIVASPTYDASEVSHLPPLPDVTAEATAVGARFEQPTVLSGTDAN